MDSKHATMPEYPSVCDMANGTTVDIRHTIPGNSATGTYELFKQPHNETNLCKHARLTVCDSYAAAQSMLKAVNDESLYKDAFAASQMLNTSPELVLGGTLYPAKFYIRRPNEAIYRIERTFRKYSKKTSSWKLKTVSETHYNYDVAVQALARTHEYIVKHRLRMQAELKILAGVVYPHEFTKPGKKKYRARDYVTAENHIAANVAVNNATTDNAADNTANNANNTCTCGRNHDNDDDDANVPQVDMRRSTYQRICEALSERGIPIVESDDGRLMIPTGLSHDVMRELTEIRDRIIREDEEQQNAANAARYPPDDTMRQHTRHFVHEMRRRRLPVTVTIRDDNMEILVDRNATEQQHAEISQLVELYEASRQLFNNAAARLASMTENTTAAHITTPVSVPTFDIDLGPVRTDLMIALACRHVGRLVRNLRICILVTDKYVFVPTSEPYQMRLLVDRLYKLASYQQGQAQLARQRDAFNGLAALLEENNNVTISLTGNILTVKGIVSTRHAREFIEAAINSFRRFRANGFLNPETMLPILPDDELDDILPSDTSTPPSPSADFQAMLDVIRREGIPIMVRQCSTGAILCDGEGITAEQRVRLKQLLREYEQRGNTLRTTSSRSDGSHDGAAQPDVAIDLPITKNLTNLVNRRIFYMCIKMYRDMGIPLVTSVDSNGNPEIMPSDNVTQQQRAEMLIIRKLAAATEHDRIKDCESRELGETVQRLQSQGIPVVLTDCSDGRAAIAATQQLTLEQITAVTNAMTAYQVRRDSGFEPHPGFDAKLDPFHNSAQADSLGRCDEPSTANRDGRIVQPTAPQSAQPTAELSPEQVEQLVRSLSSMMTKKT